MSIPKVQREKTLQDRQRERDIEKYFQSTGKDNTIDTRRKMYCDRDNCQYQRY